MTPEKKISAPRKGKTRAASKELHILDVPVPSVKGSKTPYIIAGIAAVTILGSAPLFTWSMDTLYDGKVLPGVTLGKDVPVSGLTRAEVHALLNEYKAYLDENGIQFQTPEGEKTVLPSSLTLNPDIPLSQLPPLIQIDNDQTFEQAYGIGRVGSPIEKLRARVALFFQKNYVRPVFTLDEDALALTLNKEFASFQEESEDAHFQLNPKTNEIEITPERQGYGVDIKKAVAEAREQITTLAYPRVAVRLTPLEPSITKQDLTFLRDQAHALVENKPFTIIAAEKKFDVGKQNVLAWITVEKESGQLPRIAANISAIKDYVKNTIAPLVDIPAKDAKYQIQNGKVLEFQAPQDGLLIDIEKSVEKIRTALMDSGTVSGQMVELVMETKKASAPVIEGSELIIKEIIGKAETSFAGSPVNRRHNISVGAQKLDGMVVPNGKIFSLIQTLGEIDAENGYKPELVIKGTKTTPEYGGGLCQVSTTLFRAVSYSGLPVVERRNHSYRVAYYEPPVGFDATIYFPKPDFRFLNDTGYAILIQARVEGTKVKMELWGVSDGRKVEVDEPTVFNIKKAGPTKIIETTDLAPGQKKCTERAHNGADAVFERRVTYPDGEMKKDVFKSHYVVWPAVCLVGKAPDASSTPPILSGSGSSTNARILPSEATSTEN